MTKAKKLDPARTTCTCSSAACWPRGLCARAGVTAEKTRLYLLGSQPPTISPSASSAIIPISSAPAGRARSRIHPLGQWACDQGYKKIVTVGADYAFGYEAVGGFQKAFEDCGGKIIQKIWPPLGTKDFGPYIPTIKADADAVFSLMVGPMALQFPKQLRASGYTKPIVGGGTSYDEVVAAVHGRRGDRRRLGAAIQRRRCRRRRTRPS